MEEEMEEEIFILDLDPPIFCELVEALNKDDGWKKLLPYFPQQNAHFLEIIRSGNSSTSSHKNQAESFLKKLNVPVKHLMKYLVDAQLYEALEVVREDEPLYLLKRITDEIKVTSGSKLTIPCHAKGFPPPCYQWFFGETILEDQTNKNLIINNIRSEQSGMYICRIHKKNRKTRSNDCMFSEWCKVDVLPRNDDDFSNLENAIGPYICRQPTSVVVRKGEKCCISCIAASNPAPSFTWYKDGNPTQVTTNALVIDEVRCYDKGTYKCKVWNECGIVWTNEVTIEIVSGSQFSTSDLEIIKQPVRPADESIAFGACILLECVARSEYPVRYQWFKGPKAIPDSNKSQLKLHNNNESDREEDWYVSCFVSNGRTEVVSRQVAVTFLPKEQMSIFTAEDKIALLIANQKYEKLNALSLPIKDVQTMTKMLQEMQFKVIVLMDFNLVEIKNAVELFCKMLRKGAYGLFYYAGHGFQMQGQCFIVPVDASSSCPAECYNVEDLVEKMLEHHPALACVMLDTCLKSSDSFESNEILEPRNPKTQQNLIYSYSTVWSGESYEDKNSENGFYMRHLKNHMKKNKSIWDVLLDVKTDFEKDPKPSMRQVPWTSGNLSKKLSLSDGVVGHGPEFMECTDRWKKLIELPEDKVITLDHHNLCIEVIYRKYLDVYCNSFSMELHVKQMNSEESVMHDVNDLAAIPRFISCDELLLSRPQRHFIDGMSIVTMDIFDLQKIKNPVDCEIILINCQTKNKISTKEICLGEPMVAKSMLWRNSFFDEDGRYQSLAFNEAEVCTATSNLKLES